MSGLKFTRPRSNFILLIASAITLSSCVSFGGEAPVSMLTLSADATLPSGSGNSGMAKDALVVLAPDVPRKLDTNRVPVQIDPGNVAYLKDSLWTDKPAILIKQILTETIAAKNGSLILSEVEAAGKAETYLSGQLSEFGIDESSMEAVAVFDAVRLRKGQPIEKKRFEARESVSRIEPRQAGAALNMVANKLSTEVANWLKSI